MLADQFRSQIERKLGRPLTADELAPQPSLAELSQPVLQVVRIIAPMNRPLSVAYIKGVVAGLQVSEVTMFVEDLLSHE